MNDFPYHITTRTRIINFFRRLFRYPSIERSLISLNKKHPGIKKFIPPEYLYPPGSFRVVVRDGVIYRLDLSGLIDHSLYFFNQYFTPLQFFRLIKDDLIIFDIGANIGTTALRAAAIATKGHVYAFEPDTDNYNALQFNLNLNSFQNITLVKKAIGSTPQQSKLVRVNRHNTGMNRILPSEYGFTDFESISVTTLDEEIKRLKPARIDLIKIDVEGYELNVLLGAQLLIEKFHPLIVIEVIDANLKNNGQTSADVIQFLKRFGYSFIDLKTNKPLTSEYHLETDLLCYTHYHSLTQFHKSEHSTTLV